MKMKIVPIILTALALSACGGNDTDKAKAQTSVTTTDTSSKAQTATPTSGEMNKIDMSSLSPEKAEMMQKSAKISDILAIKQAYERAGANQYGMEAGVKWQQRLISAKSEDEIRAVLDEQMQAMDKILTAVDSVKLNTPEVQAIANKMKQGLQQTKGAYQQLKQYNLFDPAISSKIEPIMQQVAQGGRLVFEANDDMVKLVKALGFNTNEEAMAYYQQAKQQFEQLTQK